MCNRRKHPSGRRYKWKGTHAHKQDCLLCRVAFVFVYVLTAYVCFLLLKYYQAYAILRQRYMTGGEAMINQWTQRICKGSQCATGEASEGKPQGEGTRMWNAIRELVDVNAQVSSPEVSRGAVPIDLCPSLNECLVNPPTQVHVQPLWYTSSAHSIPTDRVGLGHVQMGNLANSVSEETSLRRKYEAPLSMANYRRSTSLSRRPDTEPSEVFGGKRGGFMRWGTCTAEMEAYCNNVWLSTSQSCAVRQSLHGTR